MDQSQSVSILASGIILILPCSLVNKLSNARGFHPGERDYVIPTIVEYEHKKDIEGFHPGEQDYVIPPFFAVLCIAIAFSVSIPASGIM